MTVTVAVVVEAEAMLFCLVVAEAGVEAEVVVVE